jgi:hypothetical protein
MNTSEGFQALRRANPRSRPGFARSVEAAGERVRAQIVYEPAAPARRRRLRVSAAGVSLAVVAVVAAVVTVGRPGGEAATAAVEKAGSITAVTADRSGTAYVRVTKGGEGWAGSTIRWNGADMSLVRDVSATSYRKVGDAFRLVSGTFYMLEPQGWVDQGSPRNIDPDSGTTPAEYLAAVHDDIGGATLTRITRAMTGLTTSHLPDGTTVYRGSVTAGQVARETGFKDGEALRVLPFGYVANDVAADGSTPLDATVTVGADGVVRELALAWGTWRYTVTYSDLGSTEAPVAPANARDLLKERLEGRARAAG